jgi:hypothetical protein
MHRSKWAEDDGAHIQRRLRARFTSHHVCATKIPSKVWDLPGWVVCSDDDDDSSRLTTLA